MNLKDAQEIYKKPLNQSTRETLLSRVDKLIESACYSGQIQVNFNVDCFKEKTTVLEHYRLLGFNVVAVPDSLSVLVSGWAD